MRKLDIRLSPSRTYQCLILGILLATLGIIFTLPIELGFKAIFIISVLGYGTSLLYLHGLMRHSQAIIHLTFNENKWLLWDRKTCYSASLSGCSTVTRFAMILRFKLIEEKREQTCVIFKDSLLNEDSYRKLISLIG